MLYYSYSLTAIEIKVSDFHFQTDFKTNRDKVKKLWKSANPSHHQHFAILPHFHVWKRHSIISGRTQIIVDCFLSFRTGYMARALMHSHMCLTLSDTYSFFILDSARTHIFRRPFVHSMIFRMNYCFVGKFSDQLNKWKYSRLFFSLQVSRYDVYKHSGDWQQWPSSPASSTLALQTFEKYFLLSDTSSMCHDCTKK